MVHGVTEQPCRHVTHTGNSPFNFLCRYFDLHSEELKKLNDLSSFSESEAYGSYLILRSLEAIGKLKDSV